MCVTFVIYQESGNVAVTAFPCCLSCTKCLMMDLLNHPQHVAYALVENIINIRLQFRYFTSYEFRFDYTANPLHFPHRPHTRGIYLIVGGSFLFAVDDVIILPYQSSSHNYFHLAAYCKPVAAKVSFQLKTGDSRSNPDQGCMLDVPGLFIYLQNVRPHKY